MAVQGNKAVEKQFSKTYGLAAYEVLGVNLSNKELKELGFWVKEGEEENDRDMTGEEEGIATVQVEFACRSVGQNSRLRKFNFWLRNQNDRNKEDSEKGNLYKFINEQCEINWSKKPNEYVALNPEYAHYFTGKDGEYNPRPAKIGEEQLASFLKNCMAIEWKTGGTLTYNIKKMFMGNFSELNSDLESEYKMPILVATTIKLKETDEGLKEFESFYQYAFAPGSYYKNVMNKGKYTDEDIQGIHKKIADNKKVPAGQKKAYVNPLEKLIAKMTEPDYPCKDLFYLGVVKDYVSTEHAQTSDEAVIHEETADDTPFKKDSSRY